MPAGGVEHWYTGWPNFYRAMLFLRYLFNILSFSGILEIVVRFTLVVVF